MRGVTQRIEGHPYGECVRASYATLLGLPLHLVPRLDPGALRPGERQLDRERAWLSLLGLHLVQVPPVPAGPLRQDVLAAAPRVPHLLTGVSPRGLGHRCVGLGGQLLWDPHPSRAGLVQITALGFLVPKSVRC